MRKRIIVTLLLAFGVVLWGETLAAGPGVPLQGVEVNRLAETTDDGFGDGPTPFPIPKPPTPQPVPDAFISGETWLAKTAQGSTWWTYNGAALVWHQCPGPIETRLQDDGPALVALVKDTAQTMSGEVHEALLPWRLALGEELRAANGVRLRAERRRLGRELTGQEAAAVLIPIEAVNEMWLAKVEVHAAEMAQAVPAMSATTGTSCTTGPCHCSVCPKDHQCACYYWDGNTEFECTVLMRDNCDVDESPEPSRDGRMVDVRF